MCSSSETPHLNSNSTKFRFCTWNVGIMKGMKGKIDICCAQETRWRRSSNACVRLLSGKNARYKFYMSRNSSGSGVLAEKWIDKVIDVTRYNDRAILLKIVIGDSIWASQLYIWTCTFFIWISVLSFITAFPCGDWNGHIDQNAIGFEGIHEGFLLL